MNGTLTMNQAYLAMFSFLENYYLQTKSDDVANILTGLSLMTDGVPLDQGFYREWLVAIEKAKANQVDAYLGF